MAINPHPQIFDATSTAETTAINFGTGDAGTFEDAEAGTEYHIWNDRWKILGSANMTSVKFTVRDSDGLEVNNITTQHWVEAKSTVIVAGAAGVGTSGDLTGVTDDNMSDFQPIGEDNYLTIGDIPSNCYRKVFVRINIPTSAIQAAAPFNLYVTNQQPSIPITKWITGVHGSGIIPSTGNPYGMSTSSTNSLPFDKGTALVNDNEVYYGSSGAYTISATTGTGTYNIYLGESGTIGMSTGAASANQIPLWTATLSSGLCTALVDKRVYLVGFTAGTTSAIPAIPTIPSSIFFDLTNERLLGAPTSTGWKVLTT